MGELFVFLFFGLVAVNGSYYVQLEEIDCLPLLLSVSVGFLSTAILVVNNVRDLETDKRAGKRTLAVRLGRERTRTLYAALLAGAFVVVADCDRARRRALARAHRGRLAAAGVRAAQARSAPAPTARR